MGVAWIGLASSSSLQISSYLIDCLIKDGTLEAMSVIKRNSEIRYVIRAVIKNYDKDMEQF